MNTFKRLALTYGSLLVLALLISVVLAYLPVRQTETPVQKGFTYGLPGQQTATTGKGTQIRSWYGFPVTTKEVEEVRTQSRGETGSVFTGVAVTVVQPFNRLYAVLNVVFWFSCLVSILAPIAIFWHPKSRHDVKRKAEPNEPASDIPAKY
jgi:hypothetical protein